MIYLDLLLGFLRVGCFAFGGAYGAIPLIRDVVLSYGWMDDDALAYMIAVSESTPGPIMVNLTTYVGSSQAGLPGAILATLAVVLPSFIVILLITAALKNLLKHRLVQAGLRGVKPCIIGIILATGGYMVIHNCIAAREGMFTGPLLDWQAVGITAVLLAVCPLIRAVKKRNLSPDLGYISFSLYSYDWAGETGRLPGTVRGYGSSPPGQVFLSEELKT